MMRRYLTFFLVMFAVFSLYFYLAGRGGKPEPGVEQNPWITVPFFGRVKQEKSEIATRAYEAAQYAVSYPTDWQATTTARGVGFGPAGSVAHEILVSPQTPAEVKNALGQAAGEEQVALPAGEAIKLSFGSTAKGDAVTYYIFGQGPVVVIRILGPGNQALDQAARIILNTFRLK